MLDLALEAIKERLGGVEHQLADVRVDLGAIKTKLGAMPSRWMQWQSAGRRTIPRLCA
jgi:hypothetical protein